MSPRVYRAIGPTTGDGPSSQRLKMSFFQYRGSCRFIFAAKIIKKTPYGKDADSFFSEPSQISPGTIALQKERSAKAG